MKCTIYTPEFIRGKVIYEGGGGILIKPLKVNRKLHLYLGGEFSGIENVMDSVLEAVGDKKEEGKRDKDQRATSRTDEGRREKSHDRRGRDDDCGRRDSRRDYRRDGRRSDDRHDQSDRHYYSGRDKRQRGSRKDDYDQSYSHHRDEKRDKSKEQEPER